jgi:hypothetical protein
MNVYYKIIELSRLLTELQNKGTNAKPFISPELAIGLILMVVIIMATSAAFASNSFDDILSIAITTVLVIVVVPLVINIIFKQAYSTEITPAENKSKQEAYKKQIVELYNSNKNLFDNKSLTNVEDIINEAGKRKDQFDIKVDKLTKEISNKAQDKNIFIEEYQIKPFTQLYVMDKEKIPVTSKVQQQVSPDEAGKICKALEIKECFNNSSFDDYNDAKRRREEELAQQGRTDTSILDAAAIGGLMYLILKN